MEDYIKGSFYGAAIGDALGGPVEDLSRDQIRQKFGTIKDMVGGGKLNLKPGEFTDDTHMLLQVAEGILSNPTSPIDEIGKRFLIWYRARPDAVGYTTALSLDNYLRKGDWKEAAKITARTINKLDSNGGLMRTLPVTFGYFSDQTLMAYWSREIASMTHYSEEGIACCIFYNYMIYLAGKSLRNKREMITNAFQYTDEHCKKLGVTPSKFFWFIMKSVQLEEELVPGNALDTLGAALQCFLLEDSFENTLVCVVNRGGDTDTSGTVAGGLAGAYYGYNSIPNRWINQLADRKRLDDATKGFLKLIMDNS